MVNRTSNIDSRLSEHFTYLNTWILELANLYVEMVKGRQGAIHVYYDKAWFSTIATLNVQEVWLEPVIA